MTFKYHFLVATKKRDEEEKGEEWETEVQNGRKKKIKRKRECKDVFNEKKI